MITVFGIKPGIVPNNVDFVPLEGYTRRKKGGRP